MDVEQDMLEAAAKPLQSIALGVGVFVLATVGAVFLPPAPREPPRRTVEQAAAALGAPGATCDVTLTDLDPRLVDDLGDRREGTVRVRGWAIPVAWGDERAVVFVELRASEVTPATHVRPFAGTFSRLDAPPEYERPSRWVSSQVALYFRLDTRPRSFAGAARVLVALGFVLGLMGVGGGVLRLRRRAALLRGEARSTSPAAIRAGLAACAALGALGFVSLEQPLVRFLCAAGGLLALYLQLDFELARGPYLELERALDRATLQGARRD